MRTQPVRGTIDYLPEEAELRSAMQNIILKTYEKYGYNRVETPILEDVENLDKSDGGENLNLIFKILKRGEKFTKALAENDELADLGLRYDLTLPLVRYFANNKEKLGTPFKAIQTGPVFRAERPQKGRLRQFIQCDIDVLGDSSENIEIELIFVTAEAMLGLGFKNFKILVNDKRILKDMLSSFGFAEDTLDSVCITFDKLDKIGPEGVAEELTEKAMPETAIQNLIAFLKDGDMSLPGVTKLCKGDEAPRLQRVIDNATTLANEQYEIVFTPSLVRGQGYYTGIVFEIQVEGYPGSVGGGGRYDNMVEKFIGQKVPAVGFSIGFERVAQILIEEGKKIPGQKTKAALLYNEDANYVDVLKKADVLGKEYRVAAIPKEKSMGKLFKRLEAQEYKKAFDFEDGTEKELGNK